MFVSFLTVKPSPCKRFLVILNWKEQHYSTNSHGVLDATIDITIAPKMSDNYIPMNTFFVEIPQTLFTGRAERDYLSQELHPL